MQRTREQFLAGAGIAEQQDCGIDRRDFFHGAANFLQHRAAGDDALQRRALAHLQLAIFRFQLVQVQRAVDDQAQNVRLDRLVVKIIGAERHGFYRVGAVLVAGNNNDFGAGRQG